MNECIDRTMNVLRYVSIDTFTVVCLNSYMILISIKSFKFTHYKSVRAKKTVSII